MQTQWMTWHCLAALSMLASCVLDVRGDDGPDKNTEPKPLSPEIVKAWSDAGADLGWVRDVPPRRGSSYWDPWSEKGQSGAMAAFRFPDEKKCELTLLPDPEIPFGLDFHCGFRKRATMKELAALKNLRSLNLGAWSDLDGGLKELASLKNLQALYLFHTHFSDINLKELEGLKNLQVLDLYSTRVTDAGLTELGSFKKLQALNLGWTAITDAGLHELAALKNLQWLNLRGTKATAAGVAALQKELPACKITMGK